MSYVTKRGRVVRGLGLVVFRLGFIALIAMNTAISQGAGEVGLVLLLVTVLFIGAGTWLQVTGRKLGAIDAHTVLREDPRAPILYLRAFNEDMAVSRRRTFWSWISPAIAYAGLRTPEERMAEVFSKLGPFVAIGRPGESLPELGAARLYVSDAQWQETVDGLLARAAMLVLVWAKTEGVRWEVNRVVRLGKPGRVLMMLPTGASDWKVFREWARNVLPVELPEKAPGTPFITFDAQWNVKPLPWRREYFKTLAPFLEQNGLQKLVDPSGFSVKRVSKALATIVGLLVLAVGVLIFATSDIGNRLNRAVVGPPKMSASDWDQLNNPFIGASEALRRGDVREASKRFREISYHSFFSDPQWEGRTVSEWTLEFKKELGTLAKPHFPQLIKQTLTGDVSSVMLQLELAELVDDATMVEFKSAWLSAVRAQLDERYLVHVNPTNGEFPLNARGLDRKMIDAAVARVVGTDSISPAIIYGETLQQLGGLSRIPNRIEFTLSEENGGTELLLIVKTTTGTLRASSWDGERRANVPFDGKLEDALQLAFEALPEFTREAGSGTP